MRAVASVAVVAFGPLLVSAEVVPYFELSDESDLDGDGVDDHARHFPYH